MLILSAISEELFTYLVENYGESFIGVLLAELDKSNTSTAIIPKTFPVLSLENITQYFNSHPLIDIPIRSLHLQSHFSLEENNDEAEEESISSAVDDIISIIKTSCGDHLSYLTWNADASKNARKIPVDLKTIAESKEAIQQAKEDNYKDIWARDALLSSYTSASSEHEEWLILPSTLGVGSVLYFMVQAVASTLVKKCTYESSLSEPYRTPNAEIKQTKSPPYSSYTSSSDEVYCEMNDDLLRLYLQSRLDIISRSVFFNVETSKDILKHLDKIYDYVTTLQFQNLDTLLYSSSPSSFLSSTSTCSFLRDSQSKPEDKEELQHVMHAIMLENTLKKMSHFNSTESFIGRQYSTAFPLQVLAQKISKWGFSEPVIKSSTFPMSDKEEVMSLAFLWPNLPRRCKSSKIPLKSLIKTCVSRREYLEKYLPMVTNCDGYKGSLFNRDVVFRERTCRSQLCCA